MSQLTHVLIDGQGCPPWCTTDHNRESANPYAAIVRHTGKPMRIGGVDVSPAIHVDTTDRNGLPPVGPRMRVVLDGEGDEVPANIVYFGLRNADRMAKILDLAGDSSGLANAIRAAVAVLENESRVASDIASDRHVEAEEAAR